MQLDPVKQELLDSNEAFRNLYQEHLEFKEKLNTLRQKSLLSEEDEIEIKRIKLHKLSLKDQMEAMAREKSQAA